MSMLESTHIDCPYCGEVIELLIDCSVDQQSYIEDCCVCCRPILLDIAVNTNGQAQVVARHEDEA